MQRFKYGYIVTELGEIARAGKPRRSRSDDRDFMPVARGTNGRPFSVRVMIIGDEALQAPDGDRFALESARALSFALRFLLLDRRR